MEGGGGVGRKAGRREAAFGGGRQVCRQACHVCCPLSPSCHQNQPPVTPQYKGQVVGREEKRDGEREEGDI